MDFWWRGMLVMSVSFGANMSGAWGCRDGVGWSLVPGCWPVTQSLWPTPWRILGGFLRQCGSRRERGCDHACPGSGQHAAVVDERRPRRGTVRDTITGGPQNHLCTSEFGPGYGDQGDRPCALGSPRAETARLPSDRHLVPRTVD